MRRLAGHVLMDGDDVDAGMSQRLEHRLRLASSMAKSPSTTARSSLPAKAAQVFTPMAFPIGCPAIFTWRPMVNLDATGRLVQPGTLRELQDRPATKFVEALVADEH